MPTQMIRKRLSFKTDLILKLMREYPDAANRQIAAYIGCHPTHVSQVRHKYGLKRVPHPPLLGKRPEPKGLAVWRRKNGEEHVRLVESQAGL